MQQQLEQAIIEYQQSLTDISAHLAAAPGNTEALQVGSHLNTPTALVCLLACR